MTSLKKGSEYRLVDPLLPETKPGDNVHAILHRKTDEALLLANV